VCEATPTMYLELTLSERAPAQARRFLHQAICPVHAASVLEGAELLVSELVTNGVRYGSPPISVQVSCDGSAGLRVIVTDGDTHGVPRQRQVGSGEESGRGLALIDYISDDWGVEPRQDGKAVWFSITP
jgi:anti-sigma regulatory factor (Ser/Thr protein kinase)